MSLRVLQLSKCLFRGGRPSAEAHRHCRVANVSCSVRLQRAATWQVHLRELEGCM